MRQVAPDSRVSTDRQTTENQEMEQRVLRPAGWNVVNVYQDEGISGAKGRDERPAFDALCKNAARRQFDMVMTWSVDWLGRSLQDLINFLSELRSSAGSTSCSISSGSTPRPLPGSPCSK
jgi:DNA invertase Pin-like site-specific DNA recombinase